MKQIKTHHGTFTAYLNRVADSKDTIHISFVDKNNKVCIILMRCILEEWIMINTYEHPDWIVKLVPQFVTMVKQELALNLAA